MNFGCLGQALSMLSVLVTVLGLLATIMTPTVMGRLERAETAAEGGEVAEEEARAVEEKLRDEATREQMLKSPDPLRHPKVTGPAPAPHSAEHRAELLRLLRHGVQFEGSPANIALQQGYNTIFNGSYDWHSCVIAHWALLTDSRWSGQPERVIDLVARATHHALDSELEMLVSRKRRHTLTRPYDEAWFAMYLAELERHVPELDAELIRVRRRKLENHLREWMEEQAFPEHLFAEQGPAVCGFYRSWLWAWLLLAWSEPVSGELRADLARWKTERIDPSMEILRKQDESHPYDFLWIPAVGALIDRLDDDAPPYDPGAAPDWPETVKISDVHLLGVEISRLWPLGIDAARGDEAAGKRQRERLASMLERDDLWRGDFDVVAHWIPQFQWIGIWLAAGRP